jgi:hypothetical protein
MTSLPNVSIFDEIKAKCKQKKVMQEVNLSHFFYQNNTDLFFFACFFYEFTFMETLYQGIFQKRIVLNIKQ